MEAQLARYRRMAEAGLGAWLGAFVDGRLVADLGLFCKGDIGRYQAVGTAPDYRRRGYAGSLVYEAGLWGLRHLGLRLLVIVADAGSAAERLYRSVGFGFAEYQVGLERWGLD
jgi:GNAT superfamily N-acetyltransferase